MVVITHKACWAEPSSLSGYATDGGFPFQMQALSGLFDETVLLLPRANGPKLPGAAPLTGSGLRVVQLGNLPSNSITRKLSFPLWLLKHLSVYQRELRRADAVHCLVPGDVGTAGMLLAKLAGRRLFVRHCGNWAARRNLAGSITQGLMEKWGNESHLMLATGGANQPPSERNATIRWIFSSSLTEEKLRQLSRPRLSNPGAQARLVIACRQEPAKGTAHVIASLTELARNFGGISLDVLGDGSALETLRAQAWQTGVADRVRFHGQVNHARVIQVLQEADLFVFPTTSSEGFPKAVLEAMACGLPVVTTAVSVLPNLMKSGAGVILPEASARAVAEAVGSILRDSSRYESMSRQAVRTASGFSLEQWRDQIGTWLHAAWGPLAERRDQEAVGPAEKMRLSGATSGMPSPQGEGRHPAVRSQEIKGG